MARTRVVAWPPAPCATPRTGPAFRDELNERFGIDARTISGDEEARLTFLGATARGRRPQTRLDVVIDIGGGSTEYVVGSPAPSPSFHVSTQMGSVRHTERFLERPARARGARGARADVRR